MAGREAGWQAVTGGLVAPAVTKRACDASGASGASGASTNKQHERMEQHQQRARPTKTRRVQKLHPANLHPHPPLFMEYVPDAEKSPLANPSGFARNWPMSARLVRAPRVQDKVPHKPERSQRSQRSQKPLAIHSEPKRTGLRLSDVVGAPAAPRVCLACTGIVSCDTASRYAPYAYRGCEYASFPLLHVGRAIKTRPSRLRKPSDSWAENRTGVLGDVRARPPPHASARGSLGSHPSQASHRSTVTARRKMSRFGTGDAATHTVCTLYIRYARPFPVTALTARRLAAPTACRLQIPDQQ